MGNSTSGSVILHALALRRSCSLQGENVVAGRSDGRVVKYELGNHMTDESSGLAQPETRQRRLSYELRLLLLYIFMMYFVAKPVVDEQQYGSRYSRRVHFLCRFLIEHFVVFVSSKIFPIVV